MVNIKLHVDQKTGEPYIDCHYQHAGEVEDQVMARLYELLKESKLEVNGFGSDPRGGRWFRLRVDKKPDSNESA